MNLLKRGHRILALVLLACLLPACSGTGSERPAGLADPPAGVDAALWQELSTELQRVRRASGRERDVSMAPREPGNRVTQIGTEDSGAGGVNVGWYYVNTGDYDLNGEVNIADLTPVGIGFQANDSSPAWFTQGVADGDGNGEVNIADITPIGVHFGNSVTGYVVEHTTTPLDLGSYVEVGEILLSEGSVIQAKVPSEISLDTQVRQIYLEVTIDGLSELDSYGIRPYFQNGEVREYGIASYESKARTDPLGWPMVGGNAQHTGQTDAYIDLSAGLQYVLDGNSMGAARLQVLSQDGSVQTGGLLHADVAGRLPEDAPAPLNLATGGIPGPTHQVMGAVLARVPLDGEFRQRAGFTYSLRSGSGGSNRVIESALPRSASAAGDSGIAMFDLDGSLAWHEPLEAEDVSAACYSDRRLLFVASNAATNTHQLLCFSESIGTDLFSISLDGPGATVPVSDDNANAYVATQNGQVYCVSENGQPLWDSKHPAPETGLVLHGGRLFYCSADSLVALKLLDGSQAFREEISGGMDATPVVSVSGMLLLATLGGDLLQVDPAGSDHTPVLLYDGDDPVHAQPITDASGNTVWIGASGMLYCVDEAGSLYWQVDSGNTGRSELSIAPDGTVYAMDDSGRLAVIGN